MKLKSEPRARQNSTRYDFQVDKIVWYLVPTNLPCSASQEPSQILNCQCFTTCTAALLQMRRSFLVHCVSICWHIGRWSSVCCLPQSQNSGWTACVMYPCRYSKKLVFHRWETTFRNSGLLNFHPSGLQNKYHNYVTNEQLGSHQMSNGNLNLNKTSSDNYWQSGNICLEYNGSSNATQSSAAGNVSYNDSYNFINGNWQQDYDPSKFLYYLIHLLGILVDT